MQQNCMVGLALNFLLWFQSSLELTYFEQIQFIDAITSLLQTSFDGICLSITQGDRTETMAESVWKNRVYSLRTVCKCEEQNDIVSKKLRTKNTLFFCSLQN